MDFNKMKAKAKSMIDKRGGMERVKEDAGELKDIAASDERVPEMGKDSVDAIKDPGAPGDCA
jgi:hypothetical protein